MQPSFISFTDRLQLYQNRYNYSFLRFGPSSYFGLRVVGDALLLWLQRTNKMTLVSSLRLIPRSSTHTLSNNEIIIWTNPKESISARWTGPRGKTSEQTEV